MNHHDEMRKVAQQLAQVLSEKRPEWACMCAHLDTSVSEEDALDWGCDGIDTIHQIVIRIKPGNERVYLTYLSEDIAAETRMAAKLVEAGMLEELAADD